MSNVVLSPTDSVAVPPVVPEAMEVQVSSEDIVDLQVSDTSLGSEEGIVPPASVSLETSETTQLEVVVSPDVLKAIEPPMSLESIEVAVHPPVSASPEGAESQGPPTGSVSNAIVPGIPTEDIQLVVEVRYVFAAQMLIEGPFVTSPISQILVLKGAAA